MAKKANMKPKCRLMTIAEIEARWPIPKPLKRRNKKTKR